VRQAKGFAVEVEQLIDSIEALRHLTGALLELVNNKIFDRIYQVADGVIDVTLHGDSGWAIKGLNKKTLELPDWPTNNLKDTFENVIRFDYIGLILVVPDRRGRSAIIVS